MIRRFLCRWIDHIRGCMHKQKHSRVYVRARARSSKAHDHALSPCRLRVRLRIQLLPGLPFDRSAAFLTSSPTWHAAAPPSLPDLFHRAICSSRPTTCFRHSVTLTQPHFTCSTTTVVEDDDLNEAALSLSFFATSPPSAFSFWPSHVALPLSSNLIDMKESSFFFANGKTASN